MNRNTRIKYIDIAKGFCMLLVVISHITGIPVIGQFLFAPYVAVFYFLSGFVYKGKNKGIKNQIKKRFRSLMKYYILYGLFILIIDIIIEIIKGELNLSRIGIDLIGLLYSRYSLTQGGIMLLNSSNSTLWYLTSAFTSSVIFYSLVKFNKIIERIYIVASLSVFSILLELCPILLPWSIDVAPFGALLMLTGYWFAEKQGELNHKLTKTNKIVYTLIVCLSILVYILLCIVNSGSNISIRNYGKLWIGLDYTVFLAISLLGCFYYIIVSSKVEKLWIGKAFEFIGKNSIHVLCGHLIVIKIMNCLLEYLKIIGHGIYYWIIAFTRAGASVIIPIGIVKLFKKYLGIYKKSAGEL